FADKAELVADLKLPRNDAHAALRSYIPKGGTALYDALLMSMQRLKTIEGRRVVVVVTDGLDENAASNGPGSVHKWDEVLAKLKQSGATVYAVGIGSRLDKTGLQQLADRSGGSAYFPNDASALGSAYRKI